MAKKRNRAIWITMGSAHRPGEEPNVELWATKPRKGPGGVMVGRLLASVCSAGFTRATGLHLVPGDEKMVRFSVEQILPHLATILAGPGRPTAIPRTSHSTDKKTRNKGVLQHGR